MKFSHLLKYTCLICLLIGMTALRTQPSHAIANCNFFSNFYNSPGLSQANDEDVYWNNGSVRICEDIDPDNQRCATSHCDITTGNVFGPGTYHIGSQGGDPFASTPSYVDTENGFIVDGAYLNAGTDTAWLGCSVLTPSTLPAEFDCGQIPLTIGGLTRTYPPGGENTYMGCVNLNGTSLNLTDPNNPIATIDYEEALNAYLGTGDYVSRFGTSTIKFNCDLNVLRRVQELTDADSDPMTPDTLEWVIRDETAGAYQVRPRFAPGMENAFFTRTDSNDNFPSVTFNVDEGATLPTELSVAWGIGWHGAGSTVITVDGPDQVDISGFISPGAQTANNIAEGETTFLQTGNSFTYAFDYTSFDPEHPQFKNKVGVDGELDRHSIEIDADHTRTDPNGALESASGAGVSLTAFRAAIADHEKAHIDDMVAVGLIDDVITLDGNDGYVFNQNNLPNGGNNAGGEIRIPFNVNPILNEGAPGDGGGGGGGGGFSYHILVPREGEWIKTKEMHFQETPYTKTGRIGSNLASNEDNEVVIRIQQKGFDNATIDYLALQVDGKEIAPTSVKEVGNFWNGLWNQADKVSMEDDTELDAHEKTFEVTWKNVSHRKANLRMRAREWNTKQQRETRSKNVSKLLDSIATPAKAQVPNNCVQVSYTGSSPDVIEPNVALEKDSNDENVSNALDDSDVEWAVGKCSEVTAGDFMSITNQLNKSTDFEDANTCLHVISTDNFYDIFWTDYPQFFETNFSYIRTSDPEGDLCTTCTVHGDCPSQFACTGSVSGEDFCQSEECTQDSHCNQGANEICNSSFTCVPEECSTDNDCDEDETCDLGRCIPENRECENNNDCSPTEVCISEHCVPHGSDCFNDDQCSANQRCTEFACVDFEASDTTIEVTNIAVSAIGASDANPNTYLDLDLGDITIEDNPFGDDAADKVLVISLSASVPAGTIGFTIDTLEMEASTGGGGVSCTFPEVYDPFCDCCLPPLFKNTDDFKLIPNAYAAVADIGGGGGDSETYTWNLSPSGKEMKVFWDTVRTANVVGKDAQGNDLPESDTDGDGEANSTDNCLLVPNANQTDTDSDGVGDACESDFDGDGILDIDDNCQEEANPEQADQDSNGIGDVCEGTENNASSRSYVSNTDESTEIEVELTNEAQCGNPYPCNEAITWDQDHPMSNSLRPDLVQITDNGDGTADIVAGPGNSPGIYVFVYTLAQDFNLNGSFEAGEILDTIEIVLTVETPEIDETSPNDPSISPEISADTVRVNQDVTVTAQLADNTPCSILGGGVDCYYQIIVESGNLLTPNGIRDDTEAIDVTTTMAPLDVDNGDTITGKFLTYNTGAVTDPQPPIAAGSMRVRFEIYGDYGGDILLADTATYTFTIDNPDPDVSTPATAGLHAIQTATPQNCGDDVWNGFVEPPAQPYNFVYEPGRKAFLHFHCDTRTDRNCGYEPELETFQGENFSDGDPVAHDEGGGTFAPNMTITVYDENGVGPGNVVNGISLTQPSSTCDGNFEIPTANSFLTVNGNVYDQWAASVDSAIQINILPQIANVTFSSSPAAPGASITATINDYNASANATYSFTQTGGTAAVITQLPAPNDNQFTFTAPTATTMTFDVEIEDNEGFGQELAQDTAQLNVDANALNITLNDLTLAHSGADFTYTATVGNPSLPTYDYSWELLDSDSNVVAGPFLGAQGTASTTDQYTFTAPGIANSAVYTARATVSGAEGSDNITITNNPPGITGGISGEDIDTNPVTVALTSTSTMLLPQIPQVQGQTPGPMPQTTIVFNIVDPDGDLISGTPTAVQTAGDTETPGLSWNAGTGELTLTFDFDRTNVRRDYTISAQDVFGAQNTFFLQLQVIDDQLTTDVTGLPTNNWEKGTQYNGTVTVTDPDALAFTLQQSRIETEICGGDINLGTVANGTETYDPTVVNPKVINPMVSIVATEDGDCPSTVTVTSHFTASRVQHVQVYNLADEIGGGRIYTGEREVTLTSDVNAGTTLLDRLVSCTRQVVFPGDGENVPGLMSQEMLMTVTNVSDSDNPILIHQSGTTDQGTGQLDALVPVGPGSYRLDCSWLSEQDSQVFNISGSKDIGLTISSQRGLSTELLNNETVASELKLADQTNLYEVMMLVSHTIPSFERPESVTLDLTKIDADLHSQVIVAPKNAGSVSAALEGNSIVLDALSGSLPENTELSFFIIPEGGLKKVRDDLTVDAGKDKAVIAGTTRNLDGSKTFSTRPGGIIEYRWELLSHPFLDSDDLNLTQLGINSPTATITPPRNVQTETTAIFRLTARDSQETKNSNIAVTIKPASTVTAELAANPAVIVGTPTTIDAFDSGGNIAEYRWSATGNPQDEDTQDETFTFTPTTAGQYTINLDVIPEGTGSSATDSITITAYDSASLINADAGIDQRVETGAQVTLDGSTSTCVNCPQINYTWNQVGGNTTINFTSGANSARPSFIVPEGSESAGTMTFELIIDDGQGNSSTADTVNIHVTFTPTATAQPRVVSPIEPIEINSLNPSTGARDVVLGVTSSYGEGGITKWNWTQTNGPIASQEGAPYQQVTLNGADTPSPSFTTEIVPGTYDFDLIVTDRNGDSVPFPVTTTFWGAHAGTDQTVAPGSTVVLDASNSRLQNGNIPPLAFWRQVEEGSIVNLNPSGLTASFTAPAGNETLIFELQINDGVQTFTSAKDRIEIHVTGSGQTSQRNTSFNIFTMVGNFIQGFITPAQAKGEKAFAVNVQFNKAENNKGHMIRENNGNKDSESVSVNGTFYDSGILSGTNISTNLIVGILVVLIVGFIFLRGRKK